MKILVVGDFHGKFPGKLLEIIKKEKISAVVSNGDYVPFSYRKLWFKYCYGTDVELWEVIGKKKYKALVLKDLNAGESVLKKLNSLKIPVITTLGNMDYSKVDDVVDESTDSDWSWERKKVTEFSNRMKKYKNIHRVDYRSWKFNGLIFIGARGHSSRGKVKSKAYKKHRKILEDLFKKFKKENNEGNVIFLTHNVPYNTKLDKLSKDAHPAVAGKHLGSKMFRRIIDKYQPSLHIGGHIHESKGKQFLGKTLAVNPGAIHEGHYAIVDLEKGKKPKVKLF